MKRKKIGMNSFSLQAPIDALVHLDDNKNYVKHQKYLFLIELISKTMKYKIKISFSFFF
jgi:hypothetical protein